MWLQYKEEYTIKSMDTQSINNNKYHLCDAIVILCKCKGKTAERYAASKHDLLSWLVCKAIVTLREPTRYIDGGTRKKMTS